MIRLTRRTQVFFKRGFMPRRITHLILCLCLFSPAGLAFPLQAWEIDLLAGLAQRYLDQEAPGTSDQAEYRELLNRLARRLGERLAVAGLAEVPAQDIAVLALLKSRSQEDPPGAEQASTPQDIDIEPSEKDRQTEERPAEPGESEERDQGEPTKGEEGLRRALEQFAEMPISERMLITGDVTAGAQAASVPDAPNLGSIVGRTRVNFVLRTLPSQDEHWEEGLFFVQMMAAGGAPDSSPVGGPKSFAAFNDVATDRSQFNDSNLRGNLFINKAFFEQRFRFGDDNLVARAGLLDISDYFDTNQFANNEVREFINSGFVNSVAYKTGIIAPGLVAEYTRQVDRHWLKRMTIRLGPAFSSTDRALTSPLWTGELQFQTDSHGYLGNWRFGGSIGNVAGSGTVHGFHFSMDHWITAKVGLFGRYAVTNAGPGSLAFGPVRQSYSGGLQWHFADAQNRVSAWGLAFGQAFPILTGEPLSSEKVLETYYRWQISRYFSVSPDFQLVFGSGGRTSRANQTVFGMRTQFGF